MGFSKKFLLASVLVASALFLFGCLGETQKPLPDGVSLVEGNKSCSAGGKPKVFFFTDPYCPACVSAEQGVSGFEKKFGSSTEIVFKFLVTHSAGLMQNPEYGEERVLMAHEYFLCAQDQGRLDAFKKLFYENLKTSEGIAGSDFIPFTRNELYSLAVRAGLSESRLATCITDAKQRLQLDSEEAGSYGVRGTPSVVLDCRYSGHALRAESALCYAFPKTQGCG